MQHDLFKVMPRPDRGDEAPGRDETLDQFFTPSWAAELLVDDVLRGMGDTVVLEPACGDGRMLAAIPRRHDAIGVEIDPRMAEAARRASGRRVICGDIRSVDLSGLAIGAIAGNPPFDAAIIERIVAIANELLPEDGVIGLILPAHIPASSRRIERWGARFSIETRLLPRGLFPRLTLPLVWTRMVRSRHRTLVGLMLFEHQADVHAMPPKVRQDVSAGVTWRHVIADALATLGGEAELREIYAAVEPRRRSPNPHWRDKTRQVLAQYDAFDRVSETRWRLAA